MEVLSVKKYNERQTRKWEEDCKKCRQEPRHISMMPQLVFYVFNKNYGYVAFSKNKALWHKSKSGVIKFWEDEERKKLLRGW